MSEYLVGRIRAARNIVLHEGVEIAAVHGEQRLESVTLRPFNPNSTESQGEESGETLPISAAFVFIGADPGCSWLPENSCKGFAWLYYDGYRCTAIRPMATKGP